jgi:diadenosine tetraphosphate (Ap4A) HIT family hydrolase
MSDAERSAKNLVDEGCVFCRMKFDNDLSSEPTNELLYSGSFHYVICGLGAWVPGYVLLVTNQHFDNFSLAPDETQAEFISLFSDIERLFLDEFGEVTIFEHGAIGDGQKAGGCINHAHVHFLAKNVDLCRELRQQFRSIPISNGGSSARYLPRLRTPYLYVKQRGEQPQAFLVERPLPTQFLRQQVASQISMGDYWDYRLYPFDENIEKTINILRGKFKDGG